ACTYLFSVYFLQKEFLSHGCTRIHRGLSALVWYGARRTRACPVSGIAWSGRSCLPGIESVEAASVSRPRNGDYGNREALARGSMHGGRGRVRNRKDAHLPR